MPEVVQGTTTAADRMRDFLQRHGVRIGAAVVAIVAAVVIYEATSADQALRLFILGPLIIGACIPLLSQDTEHDERFTFGPDHTRLIQRLLAERAHRWIFARQPIASVVQDRPRVVDADRFRAEEQFWSNWDDANRKAEADD